MNTKFCIWYNVGRAKYLLSFHSGVKTHKDGSPFYDCEIFHNKKKLAERIKQLKSEGYVEW